MRLPAKAQASIEYMTIVVLVVAGIVIMGPYVIRSINAHFHSLDDQIQDSYQEEIRQSPNSDFNLPDCDCGGWEPQGCGPEVSGDQCGMFERYDRKRCVPAGCEREARFSARIGPVDRCEEDDTCCTPWVNDECGPSGTDNSGNPCVDLVSSRPLMSQTRLCADDTLPTRQCVVHADCAYECTTTNLPGGALPANTRICSGDNLGLLADTPYSFDGTCSQPAEAIKCQLSCENGFTYKNGACEAGCCPSGYVNALFNTETQTKRCPDGVYQGSCPGGYFDNRVCNICRYSRTCGEDGQSPNYCNGYPALNVACLEPRTRPALRVREHWQRSGSRRSSCRNPADAAGRVLCLDL
jgi:hypothetical protein